MLEKELQDTRVGHVSFLPHQVWHQLDICPRSVARIVASDLDLSVTKHLHLNINSLRGKRVFVVELMEFVWIV